jgi:hypothetical protein
MRVDIKPQWRRLANWYWDSLEGRAADRGLSIWEILGRDYGAVKIFNMANINDGMWVQFPDEKSYTAFLLRWS